MKILIISLLVVLFSLQGFSQKKSKSDPKDQQIAALTKQLDSVSRELVKYVGVYDTLKKKVVHYNFDPAMTTYLIDSLMSRRDSSSMMLSTVHSDTIASLNLENYKMKTFIDSAYNTMTRNKLALFEAEIDRANAITNLKQLRELVVAKILTEEEFATLKKKYLVKL